MTDSIEFVLNGRRHRLSREQVEQGLAGVSPEGIQKHAVRVNGTWFPVRQAFEIALKVPRAQFISHAARRHLGALGFELRGKIEARDEAAAVVAAQPLSRPAQPDESWHTEANVQAAVVAFLAADGWRILSVANTASRERGTDIVAARDGQTLGVEVKGFPSKAYADPARAHETKRAQPSTQAGHWYAGAVLFAMRQRNREPEWRSVIALPDFARYRSLYAETTGSLETLGIEVWWVSEDGTVAVG
ncbi:hypothetical protein [Luteipulveratus flavus]|uniref:Protein NO VEIN C-terminal domain-containing protein n=1 Tax=Luteipulveratus flavus TaxID=3031728 RepID=A0ABT6C8I4_9MICO|nr:hypothetical protein [Luteipulveratus sp. YIM 133296]MDF8265178.1 hypothetical protein [Luteipulveratus sp. YIM 133296]